MATHIEQQPTNLGGKWCLYSRRSREWKNKTGGITKEDYWHKEGEFAAKALAENAARKLG